MGRAYSATRLEKTPPLRCATSVSRPRCSVTPAMAHHVEVPESAVLAENKELKVGRVAVLGASCCSLPTHTRSAGLTPHACVAQALLETTLNALEAARAEAGHAGHAAAVERQRASALQEALALRDASSSLQTDRLHSAAQQVRAGPGVTVRREWRGAPRQETDWVWRFVTWVCGTRAEHAGAARRAGGNGVQPHIQQRGAARDAPEAGCGDAPAGCVPPLPEWPFLLLASPDNALLVPSHPQWTPKTTSHSCTANMTW